MDDVALDYVESFVGFVSDCPAALQYDVLEIDVKFSTLQEFQEDCRDNIAITDRNLRTLLHYACTSATDRSSKIKYLLDNSQELVHACDNHCATPLFYAVLYEHIDTIARLINAGSKAELSVNAKARNDVTPLHLAACSGNVETIKLLLNNGANINITDDDGNTALHLAAKRGRANAISVLLESGSDVNKAGRRGNTALHMAIQQGHTPCVQELLKHRRVNAMQRNREQNTPLQVCAYMNRQECLRVLLMYREVSEDMNAVDRYGNTALHYAANGRRGIVNLLLSQTNCDVTIRNVDNQTAADIAHAQRL